LLRNKVVTGNKPIALPVPNWHFWEMAEDMKHDFNYFKARNETELVEGFEEIARQGKVGSLILVDPAVPLMYRISKPAAERIGEIARKYKVSIIVDDVLRGTKPLGERDSLASWFEEAYVVEGFSKRFGEDCRLANYSFILSPKGRKLAIDQDKRLDEITSLAAGTVLYDGLAYGSSPALEELRKRNQAFDRGLREEVQESQVEIIRPFDSALTSLIKVKTPADFDIPKFAPLINASPRILIAPMYGFYPNPEDNTQDEKNLARITVGRMDHEKVYEGAKLLGHCINTYNEMISARKW